MKTKLILAFTFLVSLTFYSQTVVTIPDSNFEQALINLGIDSNGLNGNILESDAEAVTGTVSVAGLGIADVTGLEAFINITGLEVQNNNLTTLDVSSNVKLKQLIATNNQITSLSVSNLPDLEQLEFGDNQILNIDVTSNVKLKIVVMQNNGLTSLDLSQNTLLEYIFIDNNPLIGDFDTSIYPNLKGLGINGIGSSIINLTNAPELEMLFATNNNFTSIDLSNNSKLARLYLNDNPNIKNIDVTNLSILREFVVNNIGISELDVTNNLELVTLLVGANSLTSIDLSKNTNLKELHAFDNLLTSLDISENTLLEILHIGNDHTRTPNNQIASLDLSNNLELKNLFFSNNPITTLDVSKHLKLVDIQFYGTPISELDLSKNTELKYFHAGYNGNLRKLNLKNGNNSNIEYIYLANNPNLTCVEVDDVAFSTTNWTNIENASVFSLECYVEQIVNIPDANFKAALLADTAINSNRDDEIQVGEAEAITGYLNVAGLGIADVAGLEAFINITGLDVYNNNLTTLDVSSNVKLKELIASNNQITSLSVSNLPDLEQFMFSGNQNSSIDVTSNVKLKRFEMNGNGLTSLDLSQNTLLEYIFIGNNPLIGDFDTSIYPNLKGLGIDNIGSSIIDVTNAPELEMLFATNNNFTSLDLSNNPKLTRLWLSENPNLNNINLTNLSLLQEFGANNIGISELDVTNNLELVNLQVGANSLTSIDVSNNSKLYGLYVYYNLLTAFDISNNLQLKDLDINNLRLDGTLDLSKHSSLERVVLNNTLFDNINLKNGNNTALTSVQIKNNTNLTCVQVDDVAYSTTNWTNIDNASVFSVDCSDQTFLTIPDTNFEQALIDLGIDSNGLNGNILKSELETITVLNLSNKNISSLAGIKSFKQLKRLSFSNNPLTELDLTGLQSLEYVGANDTGLTSITMADNPSVINMNLNFNDSLSSIDITGCTSLDNFQIGITALQNIDLSKNTQLKSFLLAFNKLSSLDVSNNPLLESIYIYNNVLTSLDFSNNPNLETVGAARNNISNFVGSNSLKFIDLTENSISSFNAAVFPNLETLNLDKQKVDLTSLNITGLTKLRELNLEANELGSIDVSAITTLEKLGVSDSNFTTLDVSNNTLLSTLDISKNNITELDLGLNQITRLLAKDLPNITNINLNNNYNQFITELDLLNNPNLTCVQVDDVAFASSNFSNVDDASVFNADCGYGSPTEVPVAIIDANFEQALIAAGFDNNGFNGYILESEAVKIDSLKLSEKSIFSLEGIQKMTALKYLNAADNAIKGVDLSKNTNLTYINFNGNELLNLDISNNLELGKGSLTPTPAVILNDNPALTCIQIDANQDTTDWVKDTTASFNEYCSSSEIVAIPDINFERALIDLGIDFNGLNGTIRLSEAEVVEYLYLTGFGIDDLTGIEAFININTLHIANNNLTDLNLSENKNLINLYANNNSLTSVDFTGNPLLKDIQVYNNQLTSIDVTNNSALLSLDVDNNKLTDLNLSENKNLIGLYAQNNSLTSADFTENPLLQSIQINNNQLTSIDVTNNAALTYLGAFVNQLTSIDISKNTELDIISVRDNLLTSLDVSNNTKLTWLFFLNNDVKKLDLRNNVLLERLGFENNKIETLDLSNQANLVDLYALNNLLTSVNLKNGNNININHLNLLENPNLTCIQVDDVSYATTNFFEVDNSSAFSTNCYINTNTPPTAENVQITGTLTEREALTATYDYADTDTDAESGSTYQWYRSDDNAGTNKIAIANATTQLYTLTTADVNKFISFEVTPNDGKDFGTSAESDYQGPIEAFVINTATTVNGMWSDPANWSGGIVPTSTDNVFIPSGTTLQIGAEISEINSLENEGTIIINSTFSLKSKTYMVNNGSIIMNSDNEDSSVLFVVGTATGDVKYSRGGLKANLWSLVTPPVSGQNIKEFALNTDNDIRVNAAVSPGRYAIGYYDDSKEAGQKWNYYTEDLDAGLTFTAGESYALSRSTDGSVSFTGTLTTTNNVKTLKPGEWNAIGNPFTTYYPANKNGASSFINDNYDILEDEFKGLYIWNSTQNKYVVVSELDIENRSFAPGQGFFIKVKADQNSIEFKEAKRSLKPTTGDNTFSKEVHQYIKLLANNGAHTVTTDIKFFNHATKGFDVGLDIGNFNTSSFDLYSHLVDESNTNKYAIQSIHLEDKEEVIIPITVLSNKAEVQISSLHENLPENVILLLEDRENDVFADITNSANTYKISFDDATNTQKTFYVHIGYSKALSTDDSILDEIQMYAANNTLYVQGLNDKAATIELYNVLGQGVFKLASTKDQKIDLPASLKAGIYTVKLISENKTKTKKIVIK